MAILQRYRLIELGPSDGDLSRLNISSKGSFAWWYADLTDEYGNGVVCIWSYGLPFLPGYAKSVRKGAAPAAESRPCLVVSVYRDGREWFYLMTELESDQCEWDEDSWKFGSSRFSLDRAGRLEAHIDLPVPGTSERFQASMNLNGHIRQSSEDPKRSLTHTWEPVLVGKVEGSFTGGVGANQLSFTGRGYHDRNAGNCGMHELGIERWRWMRLSMPERDIILYFLDPELGDSSTWLAYEVDAQGQMVERVVRAVEHSHFKWSWMGPLWPQRTKVELDGMSPIEIVHTHLVDSGPFYQRSLVSVVIDEDRGFGTAELVLPNKIDLDRHRWLVQMRVHHSVKVNSVWLPLFSGLKKGRWSRLLKQESESS
jgi:carotenoid 1,2-hydratase